MSGGHWEYRQHRMEEHLLEVSRDPVVKHRFSELAEKIGMLATALGEIVHDLDWDLSDDATIKIDGPFEREAIAKLFRAVGVIKGD